MPNYQPLNLKPSDRDALGPYQRANKLAAKYCKCPACERGRAGKGIN